MINISAFSAEVRERREEALALIGANPIIKTYRDALRVVCDDSVWAATEIAPVVHTAETLRAELSTAALACGVYGATQKQIDLIVTLCGQKGDFAPWGANRLTKGAATMHIYDLTK